MFRKSVNSIVANITRQIDQLHAHAARRTDLAEKHYDKAEIAVATARAHDAEADRAKSIAVRLASLVA